LILGVPDFCITTTAISFTVSAWNVDDTGHGNIPFGEFIDPIASILEIYEVPQVDLTIHTSRGEAHVIIEPVNASNFAHMALVEVLGWTLICVEIIHLDRIVALGRCEQMATI